MSAIVTCASLNEVRVHIDRLDHLLLGLIAERGAYVKQAARFKRTSNEVAAPQRVEQVIARVCAMADEVGGDRAVVEATWRAMIMAFIKAEHAEHAALHPPSQH